MNDIGGLFDVMRRNPEAFLPVMCGGGKKMTAHELLEMLRIKYRDLDSKTDNEHILIKNLTEFLESCESKF